MKHLEKTNVKLGQSGVHKYQSHFHVAIIIECFYSSWKQLMVISARNTKTFLKLLEGFFTNLRLFLWDFQKVINVIVISLKNRHCLVILLVAERRSW